MGGDKWEGLTDGSESRRLRFDGRIRGAGEESVVTQSGLELWQADVNIETVGST